ncbi:perlucin-like protein [Haliotis rubra]|uniref:perlucin-like protein n=1 Tax=Haliotis rubra TaxID=36100 RepID=UPI001EE5D879|nr:perlucin-like protein [Haliotis rubra]
MLRLILLLSCAVTGLLGACPAGYKPMTANMCYKIINTPTSSSFDLVHICPEGYTEIVKPKMCFRLSEFKDTRNYQSAVDQCRKMSRGRLVDLDTPEKYGIVAGYLTGLGAKAGDTMTNNYRVWIGLKRTSSSGFRWTTGSTKVPAWGKGEPDNGRGEDCGQLNIAGISDLYCHHQRRYVCEVPL